MPGTLDRMAHAADDEAAHRLRVAEANLGLGGMNVHVDGGGIEVDEQGGKRVTALRHEVAVRRAQRCEDEPVADGPAVDEQELLAGVGPVQCRQAGVP